MVISGYSGTSTGYNGTFTIVSASTNTFTVTNSTANLLTLTSDRRGFAISQNTTSALRGNQRSMVDSVAYTLSSPVLGLTASNFTLAAATTGLTLSGMSPETTVPGIVVTSLNGGTTWVVTWASSTGHSIANGVYQITLVNSNATDTFFRLYGDYLGYKSGAAAVTSSDTADYNLTYGKSSGTAGYFAGLDYAGTGSVLSGDTADYNLFYGTSWSSFTPTI